MSRFSIRLRSRLATGLAAAFALGVVIAPSASAQGPATVPALGPDFSWGVSASGFQTEGFAPDSNWSRYVASGQTAEPYANSVDFLHRFREDIELARNLGVKTYRVGIEWARVQPRPGDDGWDPAGLDFYDQMIGAIHDAGMAPMITLDHWVYPGWVADQGGWNNPGIVDEWQQYARRVVDRYAHFQPRWITINEPMFYIVNELKLGMMTPQAVPAMLDRLVAVHRGIYDHIHQVQPGAQVSSNVAYLNTVEPAADAVFLDRIADKLDYAGLDYYYGAPNEDARTVDSVITGVTGELWKSPLHSEGIYYALRHYARKFPNLPIYIVETGMPTENGLPRTDGYSRGDYLADEVYWVQRAVADGMNVVGYNYWSLTDNYEWGSYTPRFGLYTVDVLNDPSLTRRPTDAVDRYSAITRAGGVPAEYLPTRAPAVCSFVDAPASCLEPVGLPGR